MSLPVVARGREGGRGERGEGTYSVTRPTLKNVPVLWSNDCVCVSLLVKFFPCTQSVSSFFLVHRVFQVFYVVNKVFMFLTHVN